MAEIGKFFVTIGSKFDPEGFNKARDGLNKVALGAVAVGSALVAVAYKAAEAAGVQEQAELKLSTALDNAKNSTGVSLKSLVEYASELQKITTVGDETSIKLMQLGLSMGVSADKIKEATTSAIGLSKAYEIDLNSSMKMTALALEGDFNQLQRYIPALKSAKTEAEKAAITQEAMANGFKIAQAETETYAGKLAQLKNRYGDLFESIGKLIIPAFIQLINLININVLPAFEDFLKSLGDSGDATNAFKTIIGSIISVVMGAVDAIMLLGDSFAVLSLVLTGNLNAAKIGFDELKDKVVNMGDTIKKVWSDSAETVKSKEDEKKNKVLEVNTLTLNSVIETETLKTEAIINSNAIQEESNTNLSTANKENKLMESQFIQGLQNELEFNFTASIQRMLNGTYTFAQFVKNLWRDIANSVIAEIARMIAKWLAFQALKAATGGISSLLGFDTGGVVPGPIGAPRLAVVHGGETILPTHKDTNISYGSGMNINVSVPPISTRQEAKRMGEIVGSEIYKKIKYNRKVS